MGSEDLFKKRKAKAVQDQARRLGKRSLYERVLIVCEGEKTEPNYFNELIDYYEINTANVKVDGSCGSSPISVVEYAIELYKKENRADEPYDKVFCVIDRDAHPPFEKAMALLSRQKPANVFKAIVSVPCFEYWLLLHFNYTTAAFMPAGGKSAGDRAEEALKEDWPEYQKGKKGAFTHLIKDLERAKKLAERVMRDAEKTGSNNPSTNVHELITYLQGIKGDQP